MNDEIKEKIYLERLTNPIATQKEIAAKLNLSKDMVSRGLKSLMGSHDFNLGQMLSGKFLEEFQMSSDYWKLQIKQLEELKEKADPETVIKIMKEQGKNGVNRDNIDYGNFVHDFREKFYPIWNELLTSPNPDFGACEKCKDLDLDYVKKHKKFLEKSDDTLWELFN